MLEKLFIGLFIVGIVDAIYKIALIIEWNLTHPQDWGLFFGLVITCLILWWDLNRE
jgi:hypothetical protein